MLKCTLGNIGTKIIVLNSNVKRRAGPRKGSIGYLIDIQMIPHMYPTAKADILFSRYGFSKKQRVERKTVFIQLPIFRFNSEWAPKTLAKKYIKSANNQNFKNDLLVVTPDISNNDNTLLNTSRLYNSLIRSELMDIINIIDKNNRYKRTLMANLLGENDRGLIALLQLMVMSLKLGSIIREMNCISSHRQISLNKLLDVINTLLVKRTLARQLRTPAIATPSSLMLNISVSAFNPLEQEAYIKQGI